MYSLPMGNIVGPRWANLHHGLYADLPTATIDNVGALYFATDTQTLYSCVPSGSGYTWTSPVGARLTLAPTATTSGAASLLTLTGAADTGRTASTEQTDLYVNLARTVTWATGALTTQRAVRIAAPTLAFVGASTVTTAVTVDISGAPIAGTNATITNAYALRVASGASLFSGSVGVGGAPDSKAALTVTSTTQGFLPPRMTETQRDAIASPTEGLMVYNLTSHKLNVYTGAAWEAITSA